MLSPHLEPMSKISSMTSSVWMPQMPADRNHHSRSPHPTIDLRTGRVGGVVLTLAGVRCRTESCSGRLLTVHLAVALRLLAAAATVARLGDTAVMPPTSATPNERDRMLAFALQWMPYGGGDAEDIMVAFGIPPETYFRRLRHLLAEPDQLTGLDARTVDALLRVCRGRLEHSAVSVGRPRVGQ